MVIKYGETDSGKEVAKLQSLQVHWAFTKSIIFACPILTNIQVLATAENSVLC